MVYIIMVDGKMKIKNTRYLRDDTKTAARGGV